MCWKVSAATGARHTIFIKKDDSLWGTGDTSDGQLGFGPVGGGDAEQMDRDVAAVAAGGNHTLFLKKDGVLWATGDDAFGQLGDGTAAARRLAATPVATSVVAIATGAFHSLFQTSEGAFWSMGLNSFGQLGDFSTTNRSSPVPADRFPNTIVFYRDPLPDVLPGAAPFELEAAATSGQPVTFTVVSGPATISGRTVTITGVGTVVIRANQAGTPTFQAFPGYLPAVALERSFTVGPNVATGNTSSGFIANWASVAGAVRYFLDVSLSNAFGSFVGGLENVDVGAALNRIVGNLSPATTYYYRVRAVDASGTVTNSPPITVTTAPTPPLAPAALAGANITSTGFTARWQPVTGATGYRLDVATNNTFTSFLSGYQDLNVGNTFSRALTGLSAGTYFYRLRAYQGGSLGANSATITVVVPAVVPGPPVVTTVATSGSIFTKNASVAATPVAVEPSLTVTAGAGAITGATVSITGNFQSAQDLLAFANTGAAAMGNITGTFNRTTGVLAMTSAGATATAAQWQAALRAVTYTNTAATPNTANRTITFVVTGSTLGSSGATKILLLYNITPVPQTIAYLSNLSVLARAGSQSETLTVGITVGGGAGPKGILVRGIGPTLSTFGVSNALADPIINITRDATRLSGNDDWSNDATIMAAANSVGAFALPASSKDAALVGPAFSAGGYVVTLEGKNGSTGAALIEVYDTDRAATITAASPRLTNLAARTVGGTGAETLIVGFTVGGTGSVRVLVRASGPALQPFGLIGLMADPKLELYAAGGAKLAENDNWDAATLAQQASVGAFAFPANSKDAVLVATLNPGGYTAQVVPNGGSGGVALVEVYVLP